MTIRLIPFLYPAAQGVAGHRSICCANTPPSFRPEGLPKGAVFAPWQGNGAIPPD
jgi:hypothetical protein